MSSDDTAISVSGISKHYLLFARPEDRLKQSLMPRLQRLLRRPQKQYYRNFQALHGVSFAVRRGETVGIIGRNGCGKSTLLQIVCGILHPTTGSVRVNGRIAALLELGSGFNREFTGRENVFMNGAILGLSRAEVASRFDSIAAFADIGEFIDQPVKTYSSGMQVRLAFATAINVDPDILVIDEALAVGDEAFKRKCYARIEAIKSGGTTILFVSHNGQTIIQLCSRAILLDRGELMLQGDPKAVIGQYQRLIHASQSNAPQIRKEIQALSDEKTDVAGWAVPAELVAAISPPPPSEGKSKGSANGPSATSATPPASRGVAAQEEFYVPDMKPQSTVHLEERGARIRDPRILTLDGRQVNMLKLGGRYVLEYYVDFLQEAADVGCGIMIRTTNGLKLAGTNTRRRASLRAKRARSRDVGHVRVEFSCRVLPGTYFVTCGITGLVKGERVNLHRIADALMFQVLPEQGLSASGLFDISPSVEISVVSASAAELTAPSS